MLQVLLKVAAAAFATHVNRLRSGPGTEPVRQRSTRTFPILNRLTKPAVLPGLIKPAAQSLQADEAIRSLMYDIPRRGFEVLRILSLKELLCIRQCRMRRVKDHLILKYRRNHNNKRKLDITVSLNAEIINAAFILKTRITSRRRDNSRKQTALTNTLNVTGISIITGEIRNTSDIHRRSRDRVTVPVESKATHIARRAATLNIELNPLIRLIITRPEDDALRPVFICTRRTTSSASPHLTKSPWRLNDEMPRIIKIPEVLINRNPAVKDLPGLPEIEPLAFLDYAAISHDTPLTHPY